VLAANQFVPALMAACTSVHAAIADEETDREREEEPDSA
jgi:hypothetical protein